jgi:hypothetical protein
MRGAVGAGATLVAAFAWPYVLLLLVVSVVESHGIV